MKSLKDKYCIVGVGETEYSRALGPQHARHGRRGHPQCHGATRGSAGTASTA